MPTSKRIAIQSGHQNIRFNPDPVLAAQTGYAGEAVFNLQVANRLSELLRLKGFDVTQTDANANMDQKIRNTDYDLFLAIHAEGAPAGGAITAPDPSVDDANKESRRIVDVIARHFFSPWTQDTGIVYTPGIISNNMTFYYMWKLLTPKTPCVIIECGDLADPHDRVILADTERVCQAICKGICQAFSVPFDTPQPNTTATLQAIKAKTDEVKQKVDELETLVSTLKL